MLVSAEILTTVISAAGLLLVLGSGFGWIITRIDSVEKRLGNRMDRLEHELVEVKIAVARIEGPRPHLITPR